MKKQEWALARYQGMYPKFTVDDFPGGFWSQTGERVVVAREKVFCVRLPAATKKKILAAAGKLTVSPSQFALGLLLNERAPAPQPTADVGVDEIATSIVTELFPDESPDDVLVEAIAAGFRPHYERMAKERESWAKVVDLVHRSES